MILHGLLLIDPTLRPEEGWLAIDGGRIVDIGHGPPRERPIAGDPRSIICPGFIDAHTHLPQIESVGCDGMPLLDWLDRVIYPAEMRWADEVFAQRQARLAYQRMHRAGTLGFAAFLTSHFHAYVVTVRAAYELPLRAIVGQSMMDRHAPPELIGHDLNRLAMSERGRVVSSVNPRFAVSCSDDALRHAASRAATIEGGAIIHTHLAETRDECDRVRQLFPEHEHYTGVYHHFDLLTPRTLLAHGVHLSSSEWELIVQRQSVVVHCPAANMFLKSGVFDLNAAREHGVRLALGSDVAAGPDIAMPRVARAMIEVAKMRAMTVAPNAHIPTPAESWTTITRGNAEALGWNDAGRLEVGAAADLLILQPPFDWDEHFIGRLIYTWHDDVIALRIVNGSLETPKRRPVEATS
jgi:guanine deaminase